jgi:hypothetical protein
MRRRVRLAARAYVPGVLLSVAVIGARASHALRTRRDATVWLLVWPMVCHNPSRGQFIASDSCTTAGKTGPSGFPSKR